MANQGRQYVFINRHRLLRIPESWCSKGAGKVSQYFLPCSPVITLCEITWDDEKEKYSNLDSFDIQVGCCRF